MTPSTRSALAGLCKVVQSFSQAPTLSQLSSGDETLQHTLSIARRLSAGVTKLDPKTPALPLKSIFCDLKADDMNGTPDLFWPALPLTMKHESLFPVAKPDDAVQRLKQLQNDFDDQATPLLAQLTGDLENERLLESLLMLMQRYLTAVPAADAHDTSLYDHARMTGALAAVLAGFDANTLAKLDRDTIDQDNTPVALLVGGDLSGIQDFIYTITSRGAAGALRGRSFYLQLLTDAVLRYTLHKLGLPATNVVYAGGGKFFVLARVSDAAKLTEIQRHTSEVLLRHHAGDLYLSLQSVELRASDFFGGQVSGQWSALGDLQQRAKGRRFSELGDAAFVLFEQHGAGGTPDKQCQVCGNEHPRTALDKTIRKCPQCSSYEALGDALRKANYLAYSLVDPAKSEKLGRYEEALREFGLSVTIAEDAQAVKGKQIIFALSDDGLNQLSQMKGVAVGRRFIANVVPRLHEGDLAPLREAGVDLPEEPIDKVKSFSGMAEQAQGIKRLGVLKMDVDNAGKLFSRGLGSKATLARIAHLSFAINIFFEGWVAHLAAQRNQQDAKAHPERGERLYAVYCGGDDVFFVGAWDAVMALVIDIQSDLKRYANHAGIHASAGVAFISGKYPLFRAAQDADDAEKQAKNAGKNAVAFMDATLKWPEFEATQQRAAQFAHWCSQGGPLNRSFLQTLQGLHLESERAKESAGKRNNKPQYTRATWMAAYQLGRLLEDKRLKGEPEVSGEIEKIRDALQQPNANTVTLALAARWAQFMLRESKSKDK